jgi:hypothetical protein
VLLIGVACTGVVRAQNGADSSTPDSTRSGPLHGVVVNASSGAPVPRALVRFNGQAVLTDHDGKFEFDQISGDDGAIQVIKPGFYFSTEPFDNSGQFVQVSQLTAGLKLRLYPEALLTGTITAPGNDPLPGVPISAMRSVFDGDGLRWMPEAQAVTDARGNFRLPVPAGGYRLETRYIPPRPLNDYQAVLPVLLPGESASGTLDVIRIHSGEEQHFDVRPSTGRTHSVSVRMESGSDRGFSRIQVRSSNGTEFSVNGMRIGMSGVRIDLPNGSYHLSTSNNGPDGLEEAETNVTVADHDVTGAVLRFAPMPSLPVEMSVDSGATPDKSQPNLMQIGLALQNHQGGAESGNSRVYLSPQRDRSFAFSATPGTYRLQARGEGEWYVKSASFGGTDLLQQDLTVVPGTSGAPVQVVVSNLMGSLQGATRQNGEAASCWVYLIPRMPNAKPVYSLRSNNEGVFTFPYLPPGSYQAIAFERHHSADYSNPAALAAYSTHVRTVSIQAGDKATLDLDSVPEGEVVP